ncbi:MAG: hypothetical protein R2715_12100 [Ilumatobacteraceae bacterium]
MASEFRDGQRAGLRKQLAATTKQEATKQAAKQAAKHAAKLTKRAAIEQAKAEALAAEAERAARHGDVYEHLAQHLEAIDVWLRKRDTRKIKLSPDDIAAVAMELRRGGPRGTSRCAVSQPSSGSGR